MKTYENDVEYRGEEVEGLSPWLWPKNEQGLWGGPRQELRPIMDLFLPNVKGKRVIVQAGGACGMYPRVWADHFEKVFTFEPDPMNFFCLSANCQKDNIYKFQAVLSCHRGLCQMMTANPINRGEHTIIRERFHLSDNTRLVQQMSIDELGLEECDAIQLDVEGAEPFVLEGARNTIEQYWPVISVEIASEDVLQRFANWNYEQVGRVAADTVWVKR